MIFMGVHAEWFKSGWSQPIRSISKFKTALSGITGWISVMQAAKWIWRSALPVGKPG